MNKQIEEAKECIEKSEWKIVKSEDNKYELTLKTKSVLLPSLILYLTKNDLLDLDQFIGKSITSATIHEIESQMQLVMTKLIANDELDSILKELYEQQNPTN